MKKERVVERSFGLCGKQANVLHYFLSVDSGQPPFGVFFASELYQIELLSAFYIF